MHCRIAENIEKDGLGETVEFLDGKAALLAQGVGLVQNRRYPPLHLDWRKYKTHTLQELEVSTVPSFWNCQRPQLVKEKLLIRLNCRPQHFDAISSEAEWKVGKLEDSGVVPENDRWEVNLTEQRGVVDVARNQIFALINYGKPAGRLVLALEGFHISSSAVLQYFAKRSHGPIPIHLIIPPSSSIP
jgi:hypothetical protein